MYSTFIFLFVADGSASRSFGDHPFGVNIYLRLRLK
jgi:hypothetical protein